MRTRTRLALTSVASTSALLAMPSVDAASTVVARYQMNESSTASVMNDSSGNNLDGSIGSAVVTGAIVSGATGYRFPFTKPNQPPAKPQRLVKVPDDARLDPGTGNYSVTVRYRTSESFGNILQKGQSGAKGGNWKFQAPKGIVRCVFRGTQGQATAGSGVAINDGRWHTVRCDRTPTSVTMTVDGRVTGKKNRSTGSISNSNPLTIGGKLNCDQINTTCDYFVGDIDYVTIAKG